MRIPGSNPCFLTRWAPAGLAWVLLGGCSSTTPSPEPAPEAELTLMPELDAVRRQRLEDISGRFVTPEGFTVELAAGDDLLGSVVNMTFGPRGRPVLALEEHGIVFLEDEDGDGRFERKILFSAEMETAQGLEFLGPGDLLAHGLGPQGTGLYRLRDVDGDDQADVTELVTPTIGKLGEHGPHEIALAPGGDLVVLFGNHSYPDAPVDPMSPCRDLREDHLLPRYLDPRGHARNILAPGGTIHRFNLESGTWSLIAGGFRNPFDLAIDSRGEIFTFEADMEWDLGLPWYRAVRVLHVIPGGDYGWRTGSSKFQSYYPDTLPSVDEVGRGSPVGVVFYEHHVYPEAYRGALFMGDWSRGRIRVIFPRVSGATYAGKAVDFVHGEPLNVSDLDVGPDGFLYFCTGGRKTTGGLYRIRYEPPGTMTEAVPLEKVLHQPMPRSAWGQTALRELKAELGSRWEPALREVMADESRPVAARLRALEALQIHGPRPDLPFLLEFTRSPASEIRAAVLPLLSTFDSPLAEQATGTLLHDSDLRVVRRAAESLVQRKSGRRSPATWSQTVTEGLFECLGLDDRFARYSCRQALRRAPKALWLPLLQAKIPGGDARLVMEGLLAWVHSLEGEANAANLFEQLARIEVSRLEVEDWLSYLRILQLALVRDPRPIPGPGVTPVLAQRLIRLFPHADLRVNRELLTVLSYLEVPGVVDKGIAYLSADLPHEDQIHVVYALRTVETGWKAESRQALLDWFRRAWDFRGAASMEGFLESLWDSSLQLLEPGERERALLMREGILEEKTRRLAAYLAEDEDSEVEKWDRLGDRLVNLSFEELSDYLEYDPMAYETGSVERGRKVFYLAKCVNCHVFGEEGRGGGPDLSTVVKRFRRREILESLMFPSRVVSDQYASWSVTLKNREEITGMFVTESDTELTLITATGERVDLPRDQIEERRPLQVSIMPEGLVDSMSLNDLVSLMLFLEQAGED